MLVDPAAPYRQRDRQEQDRRQSDRASGQPACPPRPGAELRAVDDALVLVAGGAEQDPAFHLVLRDPTLEAIGNRRRFVAALEGQADMVGLDRAADRPVELRRALPP